MAVTYNNLVDSIKYFADNHAQINDFDYGDHTRIGSKQHQYPFLFVHPLPSRLKNNTVELSFNILAMDLMNEDLSNEQEVHNDMLLVVNDLKNWLNANSVEWSIEDGDIEPFTERFGDYVAGQNFKLTVIMETNYGCNVPGLSFDNTNTSNCPECPECEDCETCEECEDCPTISGLTCNYIGEFNIESAAEDIFLSAIEVDGTGSILITETRPTGGILGEEQAELIKDVLNNSFVDLQITDVQIIFSDEDNLFRITINNSIKVLTGFVVSIVGGGGFPFQLTPQNCRCTECADCPECESLGIELFSGEQGEHVVTVYPDSGWSQGVNHSLIHPNNECELSSDILIRWDEFTPLEIGYYLLSFDISSISTTAEDCGIDKGLIIDVFDNYTEAPITSLNQSPLVFNGEFKKLYYKSDVDPTIPSTIRLSAIGCQVNIVNFSLRPITLP